MANHPFGDKVIPLSTSLAATLEAENIHPRQTQHKSRVIGISLLAIGVACCVSLIARLLVALINLVTNLSFYGSLSSAGASPVGNSLGWWVVLIPAAGGVIVGLMALFGSKAIRGHGIPEAMEQVLTNQSRIKPAITYLKPLSAAIAIGTGGPFGAEGPIIATGGALGSTLGQLLKITHNERKILLAAGATAGMSAIFGSPVAAIFLAIELLLFEFSPRSIIPVALACITGAAGHHFLFGMAPVFATSTTIEPASGIALLGYSAIGIVIGLFAVFTTKIVYFVEDLFEKMPIHWMWWPAIGGLFVGLIGYYNPRTLSVGYENITDILTGHLSLQILLSLCVLKFVSWSVALGSGTSGGTLAPLLTIGGATGALLGGGLLYFFPGAGIVLPLAALVGMSAMFAGASRALLTSIIFALETTGQFNSLLPLLAACTAAYLVSFFLMKTTIMTEKIERRGVSTPEIFEPDILSRKIVQDVMKNDAVILDEENTIDEVRRWLGNGQEAVPHYVVVADNANSFKGILSLTDLLNTRHPADNQIGSLIKDGQMSVYNTISLKQAAEKMAKAQADVLAVVSADNKITGVISYRDIIDAFNHGSDDHEKKEPHISLKKEGLRVLVHGKKLINFGRGK